MTVTRWASAFSQRAALFLLAGIAAVFLLHAQTGILPPTARGEQPVFSARTWAGSGTTYLKQVATGDLGTVRPMRVPGYSQEQPVAKVLTEQAPRSLYLLSVALAVSLLFGTLFGYLASQFGVRLLRGATLTGTLLLLSTPDILLIFLLRKLVVWGMSEFGLKFLRVSFTGDLAATDITAPAIALAALPLAIVARTAAVAFDEVYRELYVRTAVSKGVHPLQVVLQHVLKNAWIRVAEAAPLIVGSLVTGLVVVEYAFFFPGLGRTLGLMLERGGQPEAASSIVLALLIVAVTVDAAFGAARLALDPRLGTEHARSAGAGKISPVEALRALLSVPADLLNWVRDMPYAVSRAVWTWRPGRVLLEIGRNPPLLIGLLGVLALLFLAVFGGQLADLRTIQSVPKFVLANDEVFFPPYKPGLPGYPLGSDMAGRDLLARLLVGARYTVLFSLAITPVRFLFALPWGLVAGFRGGLAAGGARMLGLMLCALPVILVPAALLPLTALSASAGRWLSFWLVTLVLATVGIPRLAETIRMQVETTLAQPFIEGARASGAGGARILIRHVLPHLAPQLWVAAAGDMAWTLLLLAQLGVFGIFLGGGAFIATGMEAEGTSSGIVLPMIPDWSSMLSKPYEVIFRAPWSLWVPAAAFTAAITSFNLVAEGLRRRAQSLTAAPGAPQPESGAEGAERSPAPARRRLAMEWTAAAAVLALVGGAVVRYGGTDQPVLATGPNAEALTPLERSRSDLQLTLDQVFGTGDSLDRSKAATQLRTVVPAYLQEAHKASFTSVQIQQDARGRLNIFELGQLWRLIQVQVPGISSGSHLFFQALSSGGVQHAQVADKPVYLALTGDGSVLVVTGTVPGPDNWTITVWSREGERWQRDGRLAEQLHSRIPADYSARLLSSAGNRISAIEMTGGPLNTARVGQNGDVEVCKSTRGPCVIVPWTGDGY